MKRSKHSLSHYKLLTCDAGELIPVGCYEVLPGDTVQQSSNILLRLSPLLTPVMHPVHVRLHHFFVPCRLVDPDFEDFITGVEGVPNPKLYDINGVARANGDLLDYLGLPPVARASSTNIVAHAPDAYNLIYNEYYRDQDLITEIPLNITNVNTVRRVAWGKDYFTAARPWAQKGGAVSFPLSGTGYGTEVETSPGGAARGPLQVAQDSYSPDPGTLLAGTPSAGSGVEAARIPVSLSTGAADVRAVRLAFAMQRYNEARAQYGSRYTEYLRYLGVRSSDARLQRPEYLGGGKAVVSFSEVLQTAEGTNPVGTLRGHGISGMRSGRFRRFFEEHGLVMSLLSIRPKSIYANGCHKMWNRATKEDYFQKELEFIGTQAVLNREVDYRDDGNDLATFGYTPRYREYREQPSQIAGDFRTTLNMWHEARIFASRPALNSTFTDCTPSDRIFAVPSGDNLWVCASHSIHARRMVSRSEQSRVI